MPNAYIKNILINKALQEFKDVHGIDIRAASAKNFKLVRQHLQNGAHYLQDCITQDSAIKNLPAEELVQHEKQPTSFSVGSRVFALPPILSPAESELFIFILNHLTIKHASQSEKTIQQAKELSSLAMRERAGEDVYNRSTPYRDGLDHYVFFTTGLGVDSRS